MLLPVIIFLTREEISIQPVLIHKPLSPLIPGAEFPAQPHPSTGEAPHGIFCSDSVLIKPRFFFLGTTSKLPEKFKPRLSSRPGSDDFHLMLLISCNKFTDGPSLSFPKASEITPKHCSRGVWSALHTSAEIRVFEPRLSLCLTIF